MSAATDKAPEIRFRHVRRRLSTNGDSAQDIRSPSCRRRNQSLEALDLSTVSAKQTLASLRVVILSYLADLEYRLSQLESPISDIGIAEMLKSKGESKVEEVRVWAKVAIDMLQSIRTDVCWHLPGLHLPDKSVEEFVKSHLPDLPSVSSFNDMRSRLPDMPDVRSHLPALSMPDITSRIDDVRSRFSDLDFQAPLGYIPTLSDRLHSLQAHLSSFEFHSSDLPSFEPNSVLSDLLDSLLSSELLTELSDDVIEAEDMLERAARDITRAVSQSFHGSRLIQYVDLPPQWRNNPFVTGGYRFIPIEKWPLIIMSLFAVHNETLNIYTHLIPFLLWLINLIPLLSSTSLSDPPEVAFLSFALFCLFSSVLWHTMAGCAHPEGMELCARIDYVGIGWLISASVGTVVHYGFQCHPDIGKLFLLCCLTTGITGNAFPFFKWFNDPAYRHWRIAFFLSLAFSAVAPLAALAHLHSAQQMFEFISPVWPSIISYILGLVFYATHIPERFLSPKHSHWLDFCGGGSHAIWHAFIVLAISQHRAAISAMRQGIGCPAVV